jgi:MFS family permease
MKATTTIARTARQQSLADIASNPDYDLSGKTYLCIWLIMMLGVFGFSCWVFDVSGSLIVPTLLLAAFGSGILMLAVMPLSSMAVRRIVGWMVRRHRRRGDVIDVPGLLLFWWQRVLAVSNVTLPDHWRPAEMSKQFHLFATVVPLYNLWTDPRANAASRSLLRRRIRDILYGHAERVRGEQEFLAEQATAVSVMDSESFNVFVAMLLG